MLNEMKKFTNLMKEDAIDKLSNMKQNTQDVQIDNAESYTTDTTARYKNEKLQRVYEKSKRFEEKMDDKFNKFDCKLDQVDAKMDSAFEKVDSGIDQTIDHFEKFSGNIGPFFKNSYCFIKKKVVKLFTITIPSISVKIKKFANANVLVIVFLCMIIVLALIMSIISN